MYWTAGDQILRANLDGTVPTVIRNIRQPRGLEVDVANNSIYFTTSPFASGSTRLQRVDLNGTNLMTLHSVPIGGGNGNFLVEVELDPTTNQLYFTNTTAGTISRIETDGSGLTTILSGLDTPDGLDFVILNQPPVAQCQDLTIFTDTGLCTATISVDNASFDPDGDPITLDQVPAGPYSLGTTDVTLTVTDDSDASDSCTAVVTVVDTEFPAISCPAPQTVECTADGAADVTVGSPTATDNCSVAAASCTASSGSFPLGTTPFSCEATDGSTNSASCNSSVTVVDTTNPTLSCVESHNPSGKNVPKASKVNEDGFYQVSAGDNCTPPEMKLGSFTLASSPEQLPQSRLRLAIFFQREQW